MRTRIDWLYALALPLEAPGFDYSLLSDFRQRVLAAEAQELTLEPILQLAVASAAGCVRTANNAPMPPPCWRACEPSVAGLESVGEGMRAALNALAEQQPAWLRAHLNPAWFERYVHRFELARFPKAETQRQLLREQVGADVAELLAAVDQASTPQAVREVAEVGLLRQVFAQHYEQQGPHVHWRDGPAVRGLKQRVRLRPMIKRRAAVANATRSGWATRCI